MTQHNINIRRRSRRAMVKGRTMTRKVKEKDWHWTYGFNILGMLVGLFTFAFAWPSLMVEGFFILRVILLCCFIGLLIPFKLYKKHLGIEKLEIILFNILGVGPVLFAFAVWASILFSPVDSVEQFQVEKKRYATAGISSGEILFELQNSAFENLPHIRSFDIHWHGKEILKAEILEYKTSQGIFGIPVVKEIRFIPKLK